MKVIFLKKVIFLIISIIVGFLVYHKNDEIIIPHDAIRIRIIANSNSFVDLQKKNNLKNEIAKDLYNYVLKAKSSNSAKEIIANNLDNIDKLVGSKTSDYTIDFGKNYFPSKSYRGIIYDAGMYDSLVITLGSGLGDNWWCVLYPPLCMIADNIETSDVEYRSLVYDILNKYIVKN